MKHGTISSYTNHKCRCKTCRAANTKYQCSKAQLAYKRLWLNKRRKHFIKVFGGHCKKCRSTIQLEFHHRKREPKRKHRGMFSWSTARLTKELKKCDLLCKKCHGAVTAKERGYNKAPHGSLTSYANYGCRCQVCRKAVAEYARKRRKVMNV